MQVLSQQAVERAIKNLAEDQSCLDFHRGSCNEKCLRQLLIGTKSVAPMYVLVHLLPFLIFRLRSAVKKQVLLNQTSALTPQVGDWVDKVAAVRRRLLCPGATDDVLGCDVVQDDGTQVCLYADNTSIAGIVASVTLLFESRGRQSEIALYTVNKSLEVVYNLALRRNYPVRLPKGESVLLASALAVIAYHYHNHKQSIKTTYCIVIDKLLADI